MKLRDIGEFVVPGTQINRPGRLSFRLEDITALEAYEDEAHPSPRLIIHFRRNAYPIMVTFHRNTNGGPPEVYQLKRNLEKAIAGEDEDPRSLLKKSQP